MSIIVKLHNLVAMKLHDFTVYIHMVIHSYLVHRVCNIFEVT